MRMSRASRLRRHVSFFSPCSFVCDRPARRLCFVSGFASADDVYLRFVNSKWAGAARIRRALPCWHSTLQIKNLKVVQPTPEERVGRVRQCIQSLGGTQECVTEHGASQHHVSSVCELP